MNNRGQSTIIGFALALTMIAIAFAQYNTYVVPEQNEGIEYQHDKNVESDLIETRSSIITSDRNGETTSSSVKLGTGYPNRPLALQQPPSRGYIEYDSGAFSISSDSGSVNTCPGSHSTTQILEYHTNYNHINGATYRFENTILYTEHPNGEDVVRSGQRLVDGGTINLMVLWGGEQRNGVESTSMDFVPGRQNTTLGLQDVVIELPTEMSEEEWEEILSGEVDPSNIQVSSGELTLEPDGTYNVRCSIVGIGETPPPGGRIEDPNDAVSNPWNPDAVRLVAATTDGGLLGIGLLGNDVYEMQFEDDHDREFVKGRLVFYNEHNTKPDEMEVWNPDEYGTGSPETTLELGGRPKEFDDPIPTDDLVLKFDENVHEKEWFMIRLWTDTGERYEYYLDGEGIDLP